MRCLLVPDRPHWSYEQIALALVKHNTDPSLELDILPLKGNEKEFLRREKDYDRVLIMGHQMVEMLPWYWSPDPERHLVGVHSAHAFDPDLQTTPEQDVQPPWELVRSLKRFRAVNCVSQRLFNLFSGKGLHLFLTENGVDTERFTPSDWSRLPRGGPLRVGVAYTPKHDHRKGVSEFIRPACEKIGAVLVEAKARSEQHVLPEDMPTWHNSYDVYCCASSSEGMSIAVLEAMACGRPVVSTRVGGSTELIQDGINGYLVDRTVDAIAEALEKLKDEKMRAWMGSNARTVAVQDWSWEKRAKAWLEFLRA